MSVFWGAILVLFTGILCWLIQVINVCSPTVAAKLGLTEPESEVDPAFFLDTRAEAIWDALILWVLPVAGLLLIMNSSWWSPFGLVGGGMYVYFAGRGLIVRRLMQKRGVRIGKQETITLFNAALTLWGLLGAVTIILAAAALSA